MDSDSLSEHLDGRALAFVKTLKRRLLEAIVNGHVLTKLPPFLAVVVK